MNSVGEWLFEKYNDYRQRNPRYSLRAFAQKLEIPNSRLIQIIHHKRYVNGDLAHKLSEKLQLSHIEQNQLFNLVKEEEERRRIQKSFGPSPDMRSKLIELDQFSLISDPIHYSILALIETEDFKSDLAWMAHRLIKSEDEIQEALDRLERLGFIRQDSQIELIDVQFVETPTDIPNSALRSHQRAKIHAALDALEEQPIHLRDHTSVTMAIDPAKLSEAKALIKDFRKKMSQLLTSGSKSEVYHLCIQLFPESRREHDN